MLTVYVLSKSKGLKFYLVAYVNVSAAIRLKPGLCYQEVRLYLYLYDLPASHIYML